MEPDAPRKLRLRPEISAELDRLRRNLPLAVKLRHLSADDATRIYNEHLARIVRDPTCLMVDDREWVPVRCRRCNREQSVVAGVDAYACRCSPATKRFLAVDRVDATGAYAVNPDAIPEGV